MTAAELEAIRRRMAGTHPDVDALIAEVDRLRARWRDVAAWVRSEPETVRECDGHRHPDGRPCAVMVPMTPDQIAHAIEHWDSGPTPTPPVYQTSTRQETEMIRNLTPHDIVLRAADGTDTTFPADGLVARVDNTPGAIDPGHPLAGIVQVWGADTPGEVGVFRSDDPARKLLPFPAPVPGVFLVVSGMVGDAMKQKGMVRPDVLVPGTGPADAAVRNEKGHVIAVTRLKVAAGA